MVEKILNYFEAEGLLAILFFALVVSIINVLFPLWLGISAAAIVYFAKAFVWGKWIRGVTPNSRDLVCLLVGIIIGIL